MSENKKISPIVYVIVTVLIGFIVWYVAFYDSDNNDSGFGERTTTFSEPRNTSHSVSYHVTGTAKHASLTYANETGNTEQRGVFLPWEMKFKAPAGQHLYISAQNDGKTGSVKCEIKEAGLVIEKAESKGSYVIATCSGSAGN